MVIPKGERKGVVIQGTFAPRVISGSVAGSEGGRERRGERNWRLGPG